MGKIKKSNSSLHEKLPLIHDPISRRMMIRGLGASMAIPFLPSLMPKAFAQTAPNPVFVFAQSTHGGWQGSWFPHGVSLTAVPGMANVRAAKLASIPGTTLGRVFGTHLNDLRNKVNIFQGLDFLSITNHDHQPYTGSQRNHFQDGNPKNFTPDFPYTIDVLLSQSSKIYPTAPKIPVLRLSPRGGGEFPISINGASGGEANYIDPQGATLTGAWNYLKGHFSAAPAGGTPTEIQRRFLVDKVLAEFRSIVNSPSLSSSDKVSLQNYTDHLTDVQRSMQSTTSPGQAMCTSLAQPAETTNNDEFNARLIDMMVLALACGVTRIATYELNWDGCAVASGGVDFHGDNGVHNCHQSSGYENVATWTSNFVKHWATIARKMDQHGLLDRGILTYVSDMASSVPNHHGCDMPVLTAGSLGGKLRTGELISYHNLQQGIGDVGGILSRYDLTKVTNGNIKMYGGRKWSELLVSVFSAAGLAPADYQRNGLGFGTGTCNIPTGAQAGQCGGRDSDTWLHYAMTQYYKNVYKEPLNSNLPYFYIG